jgi:hypothetical protein
LRSQSIYDELTAQIFDAAMMLGCPLLYPAIVGAGEVGSANVAAEVRIAKLISFDRVIDSLLGQSRQGEQVHSQDTLDVLWGIHLLYFLKNLSI